MIEPLKQATDISDGASHEWVLIKLNEVIAEVNTLREEITKDKLHGATSARFPDGHVEYYEKDHTQACEHGGIIGSISTGYECPTCGKKWPPFTTVKVSPTGIFKPVPVEERDWKTRAETVAEEKPKINEVPDWVADMIKSDVLAAYRQELREKIGAMKKDTQLHDEYFRALDDVLKLLTKEEEEKL